MLNAVANSAGAVAVANSAALELATASGEPAVVSDITLEFGTWGK